MIHHGATATATRIPSASIDTVRSPYLVAFSGRDPRKATDVTLMAFRLLRGRVERLHLLASAGLPDGFEQWAGDLIATGEVVVHSRLPRGELDRLVAGRWRSSTRALTRASGCPYSTACDWVYRASRADAGPPSRWAAMRTRPSIQERPARSIAEAVERLLVDRELGAALSLKGSRRAATFSWERAAARYVDAYRNRVLMRDRRGWSPGFLRRARKETSSAHTWITQLSADHDVTAVRQRAPTGPNSSSRCAATRRWSSPTPGLPAASCLPRSRSCQGVQDSSGG